MSIDYEKARATMPGRSAKVIVGNSDRRPDGPFVAGNSYAWQPGQSGNPAGRPPSSTEMKQKAASKTDLALSVINLAAEYAETKLKRALDILRDPKLKDRPDYLELLKWAEGALEGEGLKAAQALLDRGHGKPQQNIAVDSATAFAEMSKDELLDYLVKKGAKVTARAMGERNGTGDREQKIGDDTGGTVKVQNTKGAKGSHVSSGTTRQSTRRNKSGT